MATPIVRSHRPAPASRRSLPHTKAEIPEHESRDKRAAEEGCRIRNSEVRLPKREGDNHH